MMSELALLGGQPVREQPIPWTSTMGEEEKSAVHEVMESGVLSAFIANSGEKFLGGPKVKELEQAFCRRFGSKYAVTVNSASTALQIAVAACGIGPGDEMLVSPYTMTASASAILLNGAVPVFVDIDPETYTLDPLQIEKWLTPYTKGILTVNIFGLPSNLPAIMEIAKKHHLYVIEDNAQSPGATIDGREAGTIADIGVFSLNYHKVIHSGEGGVLLTNDDKLAHRCQLVRNHGEVAADEQDDLQPIIGSNYRMSELHAAVGIEQLKKLDGFLASRRHLAKMLTAGLAEFDGLRGATVPQGYTHSYYIYPIKYKAETWGISRERFAEAMCAEGFPLGVGYVKPIYLMNLYQHRHAFNQTEYPFSLIEPATQDYRRGMCPVVERMHDRELLTADVCRVPFTDENIEEFLSAIGKIWKHREELV